MKKLKDKSRHILFWKAAIPALALLIAILWLKYYPLTAIVFIGTGLSIAVSWPICKYLGWLYPSLLEVEADFPLMFFIQLGLCAVFATAWLGFFTIQKDRIISLLESIQ